MTATQSFVRSMLVGASTASRAPLTRRQVKHPAAKSMIELSRAQDEEVGDGTTSVIILAGVCRTRVAVNRVELLCHCRQTHYAQAKCSLLQSPSSAATYIPPSSPPDTTPPCKKCASTANEWREKWTCRTEQSSTASSAPASAPSSSIALAPAWSTSLLMPS
jgi:hypothetical protein